MENITRTEVDSVDEVAKTINKVIDNMNTIEGRQLKMISKSPSDAKSTKKKGDK